MSRISRWCSRLWQLQLVVIALGLLPALAEAQSGRISGTVTDAQSRPIHGAQVSVVGTRIGTLTNVAGQFTLTGVPAGTHEVRIGYLGYREVTRAGVAVAAGQEARLDVQLEGAPIQLGGVVVSAGRQAQRVTDAPATVTRIDASVIENSVGNTWAGALKQVVGLDFIQVGMSSVAINARGFNSSFNNRMLMMEDGRIAVLPENGLPVGGFTATPKVDLAGVEVLVGPGAALYGADASSGVVTLQTKDPRQFPGTTVEITGGNKQYKNVQARTAHVVGSWGFKVAGEWQDAEDWSNVLPYAITGVPGRGTVVIREDSLGENSIDWNANVVRGTGTLVRYFENGQLDVSAGASRSDGVGQTNVGRNQLRGWGYNYLQARYSSPRWYLNAYRTQSTSGESFAVNRYADALVRNPSLTPDSLRMLSDWPSDGRMYAAELQNNLQLAPLLNTRLVWGAQYRRDVVSSDRQWLSDRQTGEDLEISQYGVYAQTETPLLPWLNLVLASRYDAHDRYDAQWSPKAGLVVKPTPDQALRLTYNRAFKSPTTLQTDFFIPDWTPVIAIFGNTGGYRIHTDAAGGGTPVASYDALRPEENTTWEAGYKGVLGNRLFVDVAGYYSRYEHFLSPLVVISNPYAAAPAVPTYAFDAQGRAVDNQKIVLTYFNLGRATLYGTDLGVNYYLTPKLNLRGTFSWLEADSIEVPAGREEATALNAPNTKWTLGVGATDVAGLNGGATVRHVSRYYFRSGINMGQVPTFTTLDMSAGYQLPWLNGASLQLGVSNLFSCSQKLDDNGVGFTYAPTDALRRHPTKKERECGFGLKHQEMINMPAVGTMLFVGMRYNIR